MVIVFLGYSIAVIQRRQTVQIDRIFIALLVFIGYMLCRDCMYKVPTIEIPLFISFFALYILFTNIHFIWVNFNLVIIIVCLIQAIYGILQFSDVFPTEYGKITGSYRNPAGLGITLAVSFPLIFFFLKSNKYLSVTAIIIIMIAVIISGSRAGLISILTTAIIYLYANIPGKTIRKKVMLSVLLIIALVVFIILFFLKQDSAIGRILIWQVTGSVIKDNLFFGGGNYAFSTHYMLAQSDYFIQNSNSRFSLLADNVPHPFNEYLFVIVKYGIVGFFILVSAIAFIFRSAKLSSPYVLCLISLGVFSLFSYPLQYPVSWIIATYCLVQISRNNSAIFYFQPQKMFSFLMLTIGAFFLIKDLKFEYEWNRIYKISLSGEAKEMLPKYEDLYHEWNGDHFFLYNYAAELNQLEEYNKSLQVLTRCSKYYNDYDTEMMRADNYFGLGNWDLAEQSYYLALNMCPNRFMPLFRLHKVSLAQGKYAEARGFANKILQKEVKIPSSTVSFIKQSMQKYLNKTIQ